MAINLTPEFRVFCLALRHPGRPEDAEALRRGIAGAPDWAAIIAGARRHRVAPFLLAGLQACGSTGVPADVVAQLRRQSFEVARRSLAQVAEVGRLARALADGGVDVLALKGVVLSAQLHGDGSLRDARDIDLLVDPAQAARADAVLVASGYRCSNDALSPRQSAAYRHWIKDVEYIHAATGTHVELHCRLTDNAHLLANDFGTLWREREEVSVGGAVVATLSRRRLAPYLCVHGAGHAWERLCWLVDLATLFAERDSVDAALESADAAGFGPAMLHAVMLAHDWLGRAVADRHLARARASAPVRRLDHILSHFYAGAAWQELPRRGSWPGLARYSLWQRLYRLVLKSDWRYRSTQVMRECFTPADYDAVRLPDAFFWLYPLVRPVGWLMRRRQRQSR
ncbi:MAG: hypothetical protein QOC56_2791 [Alphaproteobacteria bacterium]|nr:hypothetical protein [Alphaproteobacteria bacterium]